MNTNEKSEFERIYGTSLMTNPAANYYPAEYSSEKTHYKAPTLLDKAFFHVKEKMAIDYAIKEISFAVVALITYVFMQNTGRIASLKGFGSLIGIVLLCALAYNLFKASLKSLAPGVVCLVGGLVLLATNIHQQFFTFLTKESIEYIIGAGAFFIAMALFESNNYRG
ncbi:hypothetical protein [Legionella feeleii]|uniref:Transmembrane protein n=1 Tax=Legionella feeleii TaxID=453 RepID=A0A0W0TH85_9GAMM|nr:hypothetical protein [Legionella feeleii]KTC94912.1 hypothetical protein Lfee_2576 [Legionella feeleii]SPX59812.1 Uncharacterised protein [Legionella feeleii]SPX59840.1 Uncharacterised protein [Legionella feeleii]